VREIQRRNGVAFIEKYGPPCGPKPENRKRGSSHYKWRGGVTPFRIKIWKSAEYSAWRMAVFERDGFACVACGRNTHAMQADHILPFAIYEDLRFDVSNGRTLCIPCHRKYGAKASHGVVTRVARFDYE
jgi:5-methylcytosine-specific restriction endonuclease McrA